MAAAARALPEADRACCAEEFRGELYDLAQAATGRAGQLAHAARQLRSAPSLRAALRPRPGARWQTREALLRAAVGVVPTIQLQLARLGLPALIAVAPLAVLVLAAVCWVLADDARAARAAAVLQAWRGSLPPALRPPRRRQPPTDR